MIRRLLAFLNRARAHALEPPGRVGRRFALLAERLQVHHECEGGGTVGAGDLFEDGQVRAERGLGATETARDREPVEAGPAKVGEVLEGEGAFAVVALGAGGEGSGEVSGAGGPVSGRHGVSVAGGGGW